MSIARTFMRGGGTPINPNQEPNGPEYQGYSLPPPNYPQPTEQRFNIKDLFQRWLAVICGRSVATFNTQLPSANWRATWIALVILGLARGAVGAIRSVITPTFRVGNTIHFNGSPVISFVGGLFVAILEFFIGVGILHLIAKLFKGTGSFLSYAYLLSLVVVPLGVASALIGWVPALGGLALLALGVFEIYLAVLATSSAHHLPMKSAAWVVLTPVIVAIALLIFLSFLTVLYLALL